jgi:radical SAM/Cys-rich protein
MTDSISVGENILCSDRRNDDPPIESFGRRLFRCNLTLSRAETTTLQINMGLLCNLVCKHCHLEAGPARRNIMSAETAEQVIAYAARNSFETVDVTGGSPELNPHFEMVIRRLAPLAPRLLVRTNLIAVDAENWERYIALCRENRVVIIASFPSLNEAQNDAQRGIGSFQRMITALRRLNAAGYGTVGSGLELNLASNPVGGFMSPAQSQTEKRFHEVLLNKWSICFNSLYNLSNVPLGRFRRWLESTGQLDDYLIKLAARFNPCSVPAIMCRYSVSIDWQGYLYDCDFNIASGLYLGGSKIHVTQMAGVPAEGRPIMIGDHCYACAAGAGFTCGGAISP